MFRVLLRIFPLYIDSTKNNRLKNYFSKNTKIRSGKDKHW